MKVQARVFQKGKLRKVKDFKSKIDGNLWGFEKNNDYDEILIGKVDKSDKQFVIYDEWGRKIRGKLKKW